VNEGPTPGQRYRVRAAPQVDREETGAVEEENTLEILGRLYEMHETCVEKKYLRAEAVVLGLIEKYQGILDELRAART